MKRVKDLDVGDVMWEYSHGCIKAAVVIEKEQGTNANSWVWFWHMGKGLCWTKWTVEPEEVEELSNIVSKSYGDLISSSFEALMQYLIMNKEPIYEILGHLFCEENEKVIHELIQKQKFPHQRH